MAAVAGVDIGSLTAKVVILDENRQILAYHVLAQGIVDVNAARACLEAALEKAGLAPGDLSRVVTTGYGRELVRFGDKSITEITCHARGAHFLLPELRTLIDIGGQDSKVIALDSRGLVLDFAMNDKCAAGTGRFLEAMARALGVELSEMGDLALTSQEPAHVSSLCTVFAESEIISLAASGRSKVDILAGVHESIGRRMVSMVRRVGVRPKVGMSGGVAKNPGVVRVLERLLGTPIVVPPEPQIVGALGAALFALDETASESLPEGTVPSPSRPCRGIGANCPD
jgi:predicted CoA-substrate-specific enzyme activase